MSSIVPTMSVSIVSREYNLDKFPFKQYRRPEGFVWKRVQIIVRITIPKTEYTCGQLYLYHIGVALATKLPDQMAVIKI